MRLLPGAGLRSMPWAKDALVFHWGRHLFPIFFFPTYYVWISSNLSSILKSGKMVGSLALENVGNGIK